MSADVPPLCGEAMIFCCRISSAHQNYVIYLLTVTSFAPPWVMPWPSPVWNPKYATVTSHWSLVSSTITNMRRYEGSQWYYYSTFRRISTSLWGMFLHRFQSNEGVAIQKCLSENYKGASAGLKCLSKIWRAGAGVMAGWCLSKPGWQKPCIAVRG